MYSKAHLLQDAVRFPDETLVRLIRRLDVDSLRLLSSVYRHGSFSKAAQNEPLSASAISKRMLELETALGCELFNRSAQKIEPTPAGKLVEEKWIEIQSIISTLITIRHQILPTKDAKTKIVAAPNAARFLVFDCLGKARYHDISANITVSQINLEWLPVEFHTQQFDIAMWRHAAHRSGVTGYDQEKLVEAFKDEVIFSLQVQTSVAVLRSDHPLAELDYLDLNRLSGMDIVLSSGTRSPLEHHATGINTPPNIRILKPAWSHQVMSTLEYLERVKTHIIGLVPNSVHDTLHRFPTLQALPMHDSVESQIYNCAVRRDKASELIALLEQLTDGRKLEGTQHSIVYK